MVSRDGVSDLEKQDSRGSIWGVGIWVSKICMLACECCREAESNFFCFRKERNLGPRPVSSGKLMNLLIESAAFISFTYILRIKFWWSMEPWGTPSSTVLPSEISPSKSYPVSINRVRRNLCIDGNICFICYKYSFPPIFCMHM